MEETKLFRPEGILYSFLYPKQNQQLIEELGKRKLTAFGMDCVPRISRAQVFDALSSMSNISGYRAVVEASSHFGRFFTGKCGKNTVYQATVPELFRSIEILFHAIFFSIGFYFHFQVRSPLPAKFLLRR